MGPYIMSFVDSFPLWFKGSAAWDHTSCPLRTVFLFGSKVQLCGTIHHVLCREVSSSIGSKVQLHGTIHHVLCRQFSSLEGSAAWDHTHVLCRQFSSLEVQLRGTIHHVLCREVHCILYMCLWKSPLYYIGYIIWRID